MWTIEELEKKYKELLEDDKNVKTVTGSSALAHARKNIVVHNHYTTNNYNEHPKVDFTKLTCSSGSIKA